MCLTEFYMYASECCFEDEFVCNVDMTIGHTDFKHRQLSQEGQFFMIII